MIGLKRSEERLATIESMKDQRMATDGQWRIIQGLGIATGAVLLVAGGIEAAQSIESSNDMACPATANVHDVPECK